MTFVLLLVLFIQTEEEVPCEAAGHHHAYSCDYGGKL